MANYSKLNNFIIEEVELKVDTRTPHETRKTWRWLEGKDERIGTRRTGRRIGEKEYAKLQKKYVEREE